MPRYSIVLSSKTATTEESSDLLKISTSNYKDAAAELLAGPQEPATTDVLHFSELGVSYAELDEEDAMRLMGMDGVDQVREVRSTSTDIGPLIPAPRVAEIEAVSVPWNVSAIRADAIWPRTTGVGVKVGIMDTGIYRNHPDLTVAGGACFVPGLNATDWNDTDGHGTMCAGIVGARRGGGVTGVAPGCELYALRIAETAALSNTDWQLAAMIWAANNELDVVSLSFFDNQRSIARDEPPWLDVQRGAELLANNGCVVVGITGNYSAAEHSDRWVRNPGRADTFIAVGSIDRDESLSALSRFGPNALGRREAVELVAHGTGIRSTDHSGGYSTGSGTSFACPHVTGAVALVKQVFPSWSPAELRARLHQTAKDVLNTGRDIESGSGLIDCYTAVTEAVAPTLVYNEIQGTVASVSRQGQAIVVQFAGTTTVKDWTSNSISINDLTFVVTPLPSNADVTLLASSVGQTLTLFGLIIRDQSEPSRFRTDAIASVRTST